MMMAEGQGNGHDSPERDSAWQPSPPPGGDPGDGTPEPETDPGAADPDASWLPFKMTSPAEDAARAAAAAASAEPVPGTPQGAGAQPDAGVQPGAGAQPASVPQAAPGQPGPGTPGQQAQPLGGLSSPWQAQPGSQPTWSAPQQPWTAPPGQAEQGTQPAPGTQSYGTPPQSPYGGPQPTQPIYGPPPGYGAQAPYGMPGYAGQPPHQGQPGQAYYAGQPTYPGQPPYQGQGPYPGQPPHAGQPPYGEQPQQSWQPQPVPGSAPPLPGELHGSVPPGGESHWIPPGGYGQPPAGPPPSRGPMSRALVYLVVAVLAAAVGAGAVFALRGSGGAAPSSPVGAQDIPQPKENHGGAAGAPDLSTSVAHKVQPGLVDITSFVHYQQQVFEGTGMVLSANGLVLTNNHVIKGSTRVTAQLVTSGRKYAAKVLGTDNAEDVALLQLEGASGLRPVTTGDSNKVRLGDTVVALGNAGGNGGLPTVTSGTITNLDRTITASDAGSGTSERLTHMFQTNAPIAEGDSGGALANTAGQVIAMNTAANSQNIGGAGTAQGFSIPIDRALLIARQIAAGHGSSTIQIGQPAFIGIAIASDPRSNAPSGSSNPQTQLGQLQQLAGGNQSGTNSSGRCLNNETANPVPNSIAPAQSGALIAGVFCNAPASSAGAAAGDVITGVNGHAVKSPASLRILMRQYHPGDTVSLTWVGLNGQHKTGSLKLAAGPAA